MTAERQALSPRQRKPVRPAIAEPAPELLAEGLWLLRGPPTAGAMRPEIQRITAVAPLRRMQVPGGSRMSVACSNCGRWGWTSDSRGYRYAEADPLTGLPWPAMPAAWLLLAAQAAAATGEAGFAGFVPDACLINSYEAGARLGLHQDKDERDQRWPIVSVSLGADAWFLWGGPKRRDPVARLPLHDGDVLVWGGASRLNFHGVAPVAALDGQAAGQTVRFNLTFRKAG